VSAPVVIHGAAIVAGDEAGTIHYDAALAVENGRVALIGPSPDVRARYPGAELVDGVGCAIFPGFANTHTHLSRVLARGIYEDLSPPHTPPFTGGLAPLPLPTLTADEERVLALLGALEAIRSGTTLVLEEGTGLDSYAEALAATGLRLVLCERAWDRAQASIGQPGRSSSIRRSARAASPASARSTRGGTAPPTGACRSVWRRGPPTCARPGCSGACASCRMSSACSPPCI